MSERRDPEKRLLQVGGLILAIASVACLAAVTAPRPASPEPEAGGQQEAGGHADPELSALLGGVGVGSTIAGWRVVRFEHAAQERAGRIEVERDGYQTFLQVQPRNTSTHLAPASSALHDVFYGSERSGKTIPPGVLQPLLDEAVARIRKHERASEPPAH